MSKTKPRKRPAAKRKSIAKPKKSDRCCASTTAEHLPDCATWQAKQAFDEQRSRNEAMGMEVCMVVVGYVSGRDPFRLLGRVAADLGESAMPDPPLTMTEMQPVAFAAKMAIAKVLSNRRRAAKGARR